MTRASFQIASSSTPSIRGAWVIRVGWKGSGAAVGAPALAGEGERVTATRARNVTVGQTSGGEVAISHRPGLGREMMVS